MRLRLTGAHAAVFACLAAAASCFPDPPADDGLADGGIFLSEGGPGTGDANVNGLVVSAASIDFGLAECGGQPPAHQTITLTNTSGSEVSYAAAPSGPDFQIVSTTTGKIAAGASVSLEMSASAVSAFATAGGLVEGALQIVTDAPGQKLFVVDLRETAEGASLVLIPSTASFGRVEQDTTQAIDMGFRNNGNEPLLISLDTGELNPVFTFDAPDAGSITVAGNSTVSVHATYTPNAATSEEGGDFGSVGFTTTGVICGGGELPASISLRGGGIFTGYPSITPGIATFDVGGTGLVPCGKSADATKTITVSNPSSAEFTDLAIMSTIVTGPFSVSPSVDTSDGGVGLAVLPGTAQALTVTALPVTAPASTSPEGLSGTLEIILSNEDDIIVQLSQTAQGAVFSFSPSTQIDFGTAAIDTLATQLLGITNSGNAAASITLGVTGSPYFTAFPSAQFSVNTPGTQATVGFLPVTSGAQTATLAMTTSGAVCGSPLPSSITLTGNGVLPADSGSDSGRDSGGVTDSGGDADDTDADDTDADDSGVIDEASLGAEGS
ncbi:MAG: hypothetical protein ACRELY_12355 [Polyangiaceae bacterium]